MTAVLMGSHHLAAQEGGASKTEAKQKEKATAGKVVPPDPMHRVPPGYARLDLTEAQKEALYKIQAKYYPQIQALEKQVEELRDKREAECEAVLKPAQKKKLQERESERKAAAKAKRAARDAEEEKAP